MLLYLISMRHLKRETMLLDTRSSSLGPTSQAYHLCALEGFELMGWWTNWLVPLLLSPCPCPIPLKISCKTGRETVNRADLRYCVTHYRVAVMRHNYTYLHESQSFVNSIADMRELR